MQKTDQELKILKIRELKRIISAHEDKIRVSQMHISKNFTKIMNLKPKRITVFDKSGDVEKFNQVFKEDQQCEQCQTIGAFFIEDDSNSFGLCLKHIHEAYDGWVVIE